MADELITETTEASTEETSKDTPAVSSEDKPEIKEADKAAPNWRDPVTDPERRKVAERFNTLDDAMKAIVDLRKRESTAVRLPGKNASETERLAFRKAMGIPDAPEGYTFVMPEGKEANDSDKEFQKHFASIFHSADLSAAQASKLNQAWNEYTAKIETALVDEDKRFAKETEDNLKREWGDDFDRNRGLASRAARELLGPDLDVATRIETKDGHFLLDHPILMRMFANAGSEMSEGRIGPRIGDSERASLEEQIDELERKKMDAYYSGDRRTAKRLDEQQATLIEKVQSSKA